MCSVLVNPSGQGSAPNDVHLLWWQQQTALGHPAGVNEGISGATKCNRDKGRVRQLCPAASSRQQDPGTPWDPALEEGFSGAATTPER